MNDQIGYRQLDTGGIPLRVASERSHFYLGVDVGQKRDYTAMAIVERVLTMYAARDPVKLQPLERVDYRLRYLKRLPLGMPYAAADGDESIVRGIEETYRRLKREHGGIHGSQMGQGFTVVVDATGVGAPVADLLRKARLGCELAAVTITAGSKASETQDGWHVPKRELMTGLLVMVEQRELWMSKEMPLREELLEELGSVEMKLTGAGKDVYGVWAEGLHDDLVLAVALAAWRARVGPRSPWGMVRLV